MHQKSIELQETKQTDILLQMRYLGKLHEGILKKHCGQYHLSQMEMTVLSFLHNNPSCDTAAEIVVLRRVPKGQVSQAVEALIQKGYLRRTTDAADRRRIHLSMTEAAKPVVKLLEQCNAEYQQRLFAGFSETERSRYKQLHQRMVQNAKEEMERMMTES